MAITIDLIIIAIILLFTFLGYKRGLIKVAIKLCTFFIAIIVAIIFFKPITNLVVENTNIDENIESAIVSRILPEDSSQDEQVDLSNKLPSIILETGKDAVQDIAKSLSNTIIGASCFLIIFIVVKIVLRFITALADLIAKLPILKQFNKIGGTLYGILEGLFIVFVGLTIVSFIAPLLDTSILDSINSSHIGSILYNNNILLKFIV